MSTITAEARLTSRAVARAHSVVRRRRYLSNLGTLMLSLVLIVWTIAPIYNMVLISLEPTFSTSASTAKYFIPGLGWEN